MADKMDADAFRERVWRMVSPRIGPALSLPQIDRVRALLFPEIRVTQIALPFDDPTASTSPADDRLLAVMDMQQELLARSMGDASGLRGQDDSAQSPRRAAGAGRSASAVSLLDHVGFLDDAVGVSAADGVGQHGDHDLFAAIILRQASS